ncbi:MAG TPA: ATP-binding protein [Sediminibacterium sp.]|nr:ATP-binding protein [Sediminibacterium sp.]
MEELIGRRAEKQILEDALTSKSPELIAVYGRRRVGKTFLIRSVYQKHLVFVGVTKTQKTIFLTMITTYGTVRNAYYNKLIQSELTMDNLFAL